MFGVVLTVLFNCVGSTLIFSNQNNPNFPHKLPHFVAYFLYSVSQVPPVGCCVSLSFSEMETIAPVPGGT